MTTNNLTELWKKGELPTGIYYIIDYEDLEVIDEYVNGFGFVKFEPKEVLAPVPSYGEWKAFNNGYEATIDANLKQATWMMKMEEENQNLKELLKECRDGLDKVKHIAEVKNLAAVYQVAERTLTKIDEVLKND